MENYFKIIFIIITIFMILFPNIIKSADCPNIFPYFGIVSSCILKNRNQVNCFGSLNGVVKAYVQCENGYFNKQNITQQILKCNEGEWSEEIIKCIPECIEPPNNYEIIKNNKNLQSEFWYAEIIRKEGEIYKIPAIILNENLILTSKKFFNVSKDFDFIFKKEFNETFEIRIYNNETVSETYTISNIKCYNTDDTDESEDLDELDESDKFCVVKISEQEYIEFKTDVKPICRNGKSFVSITKLVNFCRSNNLQNLVSKCVVPSNSDTKVETVCLNSTVNENNKNNLVQTECLEASDYLTRRCKIGYQYLNPKRDDYISGCAKGSWKYEDNGCDLTCGEIYKNISSKFQLAYKGKKTDIILSPWHVGIFQKSANISNRFEQLCGGTIIDSNIILSAAHCFYDAANDRLFDESIYLVGGGKTFRNFRVSEKYSYYIRIKQIYIPTNYNPISTSNDIAILLLKDHFQFSSHIKPVCIDFSHYKDYSIKSGIMGNITGWGHTSADQKVSDTLLITSLKTLTNDECKDRLDPNFMSDIVGDKFCAVNEQDNASACRGDSGGGFIIKKQIGNEERHYLIGIVSEGINREKYCSDGFTTLFTNIQFYQNFIIDIISEIRNENLISVNNKIFEYENKSCDISNINFAIEEDNICGKIDDFEPFIRPFELDEGKKLDITSAPWHMGIYFKNKNYSSNFSYLCAGNIILSNIIISAAHCFYSEGERVTDKYDYLAGTGKSNQTYEVIEEHEYFTNIKDIHIPNDFNSEYSINDISILILDDHLKFSSYIRPVCIDFTSNNDYTMSNVFSGYITGWGATTSTSDDLIVAKLNTLKNKDCKELVSSKYASEITGDKFCAISPTVRLAYRVTIPYNSDHNSTLCRGVSGGGFVVMKNIASENRFYLKGIVSTGIRSSIECSEGFLPLFSNIQFNQNFIKDIIAKNRIENKVYNKIFSKIKEILN